MFTRNHFSACSALALAVAAITLVFVGCSSKSTMDTNPSGTTVAVGASPTSLSVGGTSIVEATITIAAEAAADYVVAFSVSPSSAGYCTPAVDTSGTDGIAATVFTATSAGTATITASVEGMSASNTVSLVIADDGTPGGSGNVTIAASPSVLVADGQDTSLITVTVRDVLSQPAPESTVVRIVAGESFADLDGNGYWSQGSDSLIYDANANGQWDAIGMIASTALTSGSAGTATAAYISGSEATTVYIKATVDDNGITGNAQLSLQLSPNAAIYSIYLSSDSMQLTVAGTGGIETGMLHAIGYDVNGNTVPAGLPVQFTILDGPGGGEGLGELGVGPYPTYTNSQGVASAPIHSGTASGTVRFRANSGTVMSTAAYVLISAGPPAYIVIGAKECNVDYWDDVAEQNEITAVVSDAYLNPVNDSTVVYFSCDEGTMKSHQDRTKDHEGVAGTIWLSGNNVATADGIVAIMAETAGGTVADTSYFFNTHYPAVISVFDWQTSLLADGESNFWAVVSAVDLNGNPVIGGTAFKAGAQYLNVSGGSFENGCYGAFDRVQVTSKILKVDASVTGVNDDGIGAIDSVIYWHPAGAAVWSVCTLLTGYAYSGQCRINGQNNASPSEVIHLTVTIKDRYGNPLADHTLVMTASGGTVVGGTQETDAYGEATGFTWSALGLGDYTLTVTDTDPRGGIILTHRVTIE